MLALRIEISPIVREQAMNIEDAGLEKISRERKFRLPESPDALKMRLLNAHTRVDLQEFLNRSGYFPVEIDEKGKKVRRRRWEMRHITRPVIQIWRIYSSLLRAAMKQPTDLVKRDTF